jgi:hypothetical protein
LFGMAHGEDPCLAARASAEAIRIRRLAMLLAPRRTAAPGRPRAAAGRDSASSPLRPRRLAAGQTLTPSGAEPPQVSASLTTQALGPSTRRPECLYSGCRGNPTMAINVVRNSRCGPGGSARRLHHPAASRRKSGGRPLMGANQDRRAGKGAIFARHGTAVIGPIQRCQRQRGSRCQGCLKTRKRV